MGLFARGDLVLVPFPCSGAPGEKLRPALVLTSWNVGQICDCLVCMVTSQAREDGNAVDLLPSDVQPTSALHKTSYIRPLYMYSVGQSRIRRKIGTVSESKANLALATVTKALG